MNTTSTQAKLEELVHRLQATPEYSLEEVLFEINEQICELMESQGVTKAELASRLGASRAWITKLLKVNRNITVKSLVLVANALDSTIEMQVAPKKASKQETIVSVSVPGSSQPALTVYGTPAIQVIKPEFLEDKPEGTNNYALAA